MITRILLLVICSFLLAAAAPNKFAAKFRMSQDPNIEGIITGQMYYDLATKTIRSDLNVGAIEVMNYTKVGQYVRYLGCNSGSVCNVETWKFDMPKYYPEATDTSVANNISYDGRNCIGYQKPLSNIQNIADNQVKYLFVDSSDKVCRAVFGNGKIVDFLNVTDIPNGFNMSPQTSWNCPVQTCSKLIDIILIFDQSGSIDDESFQKEKNFATNFAKAFKFGPNDVAMELIMFANSATRIMPLSVDKSGVLAFISDVKQSDGKTCIGCGIQMATNDFNTYGRSRAAKVAIVLTDGQNNVKVNEFSGVVNAAKNAGIILFAIGIDGYNITQLQFIASSIPGVQTVFQGPDFNSLSLILDSFISSTCIDVPGNPCGTGCRGYCCCNKECRCPDTCDDYDACTVDRCVNGTNGNGCTYSRRICDDNNACTFDYCNSKTGCLTSVIDCNDNDPCTDDYCDTVLGCQHKPTSCDDGDACTYDYCLSNSTGCRNIPIDCGNCSSVFAQNKTCPVISCAVNECHPSTGNCAAKNITCNDGNACSNDYCDIATGTCKFDPIVCDDENFCTLDTCDPNLGCVYTPVASDYCDDGSICTTDSCVPTIGCLNSPIDCDDDNNCTVDGCNSILGCTYLPRDCSLEIVSSKCTSSACNVVTGCYLFPIAGQIQSCGKCVGDGPCDNIGVVAGVASATVVGVSIAAAVVAAAIAGISGRAGYKVYMKNKNNMNGAQMSPLYTDNGMSGTNPFFDGTAATNA